VLAVALCLADVSRTEDEFGWLVVTSPDDPSADVLHEDRLRSSVMEVGRHDGAYFYVIARDLTDLDVAAAHLDRSHYRMQRILYPALAGVLHPSPGEGLVWAMFAVGVVGVFLGGAGTAALSQTLGGPSWPGVVFGVLPGVYISLRISVPDPLALGLAIWAIFFSLRGRSLAAIALGVLAVLTRESTWLVLLGFALWRRDRDAVGFALVPAMAAAAWWAFLHATVPSQGDGVIELTWPLAGWWDAWQFWGDGHERRGLFAAMMGLVVLGFALAKRGLRHPLGWVLLLHLGLLAVLIASAVAPERSAGRTMLPVIVLGIVALVTPASAAAAGDARSLTSLAPEPTSSGEAAR
jgi:hypothetical protein